MKRILITGSNSYIGTNVERYLSQYSDSYFVQTVNVKNNQWKNMDFSSIDVILHVAGIAHVKESKINAHLYYDVNEKLAIDIAEKAKSEGVKQFIVLSTMSVYGLNVGHITKKTIPSPINNYGKSKYNADIKLGKMRCNTFKVAILRPPMVYGKGCKGNYQILRKFALGSPVFPDYRNKRSMIYIGNLIFFIKQLIDNEDEGLFFPQDSEYVCTTEMVKQIAKFNEKKIKTSTFFNFFIYILLKFNLSIFEKVFGDLTYEKVDLVQKYSFKQAMIEMEET